MVEVHRVVVGVEVAWFNAVGDHAIDAVGTAGQHIDDAWAFTALIPAAFNLVRRDCAAPQEIIR
ncbi:hypothetical protein D3C72_1896850 [compost metagenome]